MVRIYVRKSKRMLDGFDVVGLPHGKIVRTRSKSRANEIANAGRRVREKRRLRRG